MIYIHENQLFNSLQMNKQIEPGKPPLSSLDQTANNLGIGGMNSSGNEESYKRRMQRRKEVQSQRVSNRDQEKGLIIVFTGNGKGKTTAALGLALRTIGHGKRVAIIQFIKGGWEPGEAKALKMLGENINFHALGEGFTWETQNRERDKELVAKAWDKAILYLKDEDHKLVILDEINIALKLGYITLNEVLDGINKRPKLTHVALTGRGAPKELICQADLVTEMNLIRHPFKEQGIKAQLGIEF